MSRIGWLTIALSLSFTPAHAQEPQPTIGKCTLEIEPEGKLTKNKKGHWIFRQTKSPSWKSIQNWGEANNTLRSIQSTQFQYTSKAVFKIVPQLFPDYGLCLEEMPKICNEDFLATALNEASKFYSGPKADFFKRVRKFTTSDLSWRCYTIVKPKIGPYLSEKGVRINKEVLTKALEKFLREIIFPPIAVVPPDIGLCLFLSQLKQTALGAAMISTVLFLQRVTAAATSIRAVIVLPEAMRRKIEFDLQREKGGKESQSSLGESLKGDATCRPLGEESFACAFPSGEGFELHDLQSEDPAVCPITPPAAD